MDLPNERGSGKSTESTDLSDSTAAATSVKQQESTETTVSSMTSEWCVHGEAEPSEQIDSSDSSECSESLATSSSFAGPPKSVTSQLKDLNETAFSTDAAAKPDKPMPILELPSLVLLQMLDELCISDLFQNVSLVNRKFHDLIPIACIRRKHLTLMVGVPGNVLTTNLTIFLDPSKPSAKYGTHQSRLRFNLRHRCCGGLTAGVMQMIVKKLPNVTTLEILGNQLCTDWFRNAVNVFLGGPWAEKLTTLRVMVNFFESGSPVSSEENDITSSLHYLIHFINRRTSLPNLQNLTLISPNRLFPLVYQDVAPAARSIRFPLLRRLQTVEIHFGDNISYLLDSLETFAMQSESLKDIKIGLRLTETAMTAFKQYPLEFAKKFTYLRIGYLLTSHDVLRDFVLSFENLRNIGVITGPNEHYCLVLSHLSRLAALRHLDLKVLFPCSFYNQKLNFGKRFKAQVAQQLKISVENGWDTTPCLNQLTSLYLDVSYRSHEELTKYNLHSVFPSVTVLVIGTENNYDRTCLACKEIENNNQVEDYDEYPTDPALDDQVLCALRAIHPVPPKVHICNVVKNRNRGNIKSFLCDSS